MGIWDEMRKQSIGDTIKREDEEGPFLDADHITEAELKEMLHQGVVHFVYQKIKFNMDDPKGRREAWGTLDMGVVSKIPHSGSSNTRAAGYINYFDVDSGDWRAFLPERLIGVYNRIYTSEDYDVNLLRELIKKSRESSKKTK